MGGVIAYDNNVKERLLGVPAQLIEQYGAVSHEVAAAMASGVRKHLNSALGVSITGIAGPDGGTPNKPVGTTYVSLTSEDAVITRHFHFQAGRGANREASVDAALHLIVDYLEDMLRRAEA
jgi:nicotinamide-nucleotide amidase